MKISIITVVFNNYETIQDTIDSVFNQTYKNIEHIVIDGHSIDGTQEIILLNAQKISLFVSEKDKGLYDAMNKGLSAASGDVIGILNSDDLFYDEHVLMDIANAFQNEENLDVLYGNIVYVKQHNIKKIVRKWVSSSYFSKYFEFANVPPHPALFVRKQVVDQVGRFNLDYKLAADYEYMLRLFKKHQFRTMHIPRFFVKMRLGGATNKNLNNVFKGNLEIYKAWKLNGLVMPIYFFPLKIIKRLAQFV